MSTLRSSVENIYRLLILVFLLASFMMTVGEVIAASKVPTSRVFVPEETQSKTAEEFPETIEIPTENLPEPGAIVNEAAEPQENQTQPVETTNPKVDPPEILRDISKLPAPVRLIRQKILDAAATGIIENLRPFVKTGDEGTNFSLGGLDGDPIKFLQSSSGDPEGQEILAILTEILEAGYVHLDEGTEEELFIWPYFFAVSLEKLTPPQRVELFRILTFGDLEDSTSFGGYLFYRMGIKPDGTWSFFLAGD